METVIPRNTAQLEYMEQEQPTMTLKGFDRGQAAAEDGRLLACVPHVVLRPIWTAVQWDVCVVLFSHTRELLTI